MALLPALLTAGGRVIDVGANYGLYSYAALRSRVSIELFEPNRHCLRALEAWSDALPMVRVHPCALSAAEGRGRLSIPVEANGMEHDASASLEPRQGGSFRVETVSLRTLDSFGFEQVDLIKIDVEGHEAQVIEGARETIAACRPALLVEIEQRHCPGPIGETFDRIAALGYAGYFLQGGRLTDLGRFRLAEHQSLAALGSRSRAYHNNFLFLAHRRLADGCYRKLLA